MRSIVHEYFDRDENVCFRCGCNRNKGRERHHIFGGPNRKLSEADGLWIYLCSDCHRLIHNDASAMRWAHCHGKEAYLQNHTEQEFLERYGRNYD